MCDFFFSFLSNLSWQKHYFLSPKYFSLNLFTFPTCFSAQTLCSSSGMISFLSFIMHFIHLDLGFLGFWKFLGFFKIDEVFVKFLGWLMFKRSYMLMHCITFVFSQCFMHVRCVFYMLKPCVLVGLDWAKPMMFILLHVRYSYIFHAYVPFFSFF